MLLNIKLTDAAVAGRDGMERYWADAFFYYFDFHVTPLGGGQASRGSELGIIFHLPINPKPDATGTGC